MAQGCNLIKGYRRGCYLGIDFASNGAWDVHIKKVINNGKKKLHSFISN